MGMLLVLIIKLAILILWAANVLSSLDVDLEYFNFLNIELVGTSQCKHGGLFIIDICMRSHLGQFVFLAQSGKTEL